MRQLHAKSGSSARLSDFAVDIRAVVKANCLPEYELSIARNPDGEECVYFLHLSQLGDNHPRWELQAKRFRETAQATLELAHISSLSGESTGD